MKITSNIMREAHRLTKEDCKYRKDLNYKVQLGLNISFILKRENSWSEAIKAKIAFYKEIGKLAKTITTKGNHEILTENEVLLLTAKIFNVYNIDLYQDLKRYANISISNIASEVYESVNNIDKRLRLERCC